MRKGKPIIQEGVCVLGVTVAIKTWALFFFGGDPSMCQQRASSRTMKARRIIKIPQRIWDAYQIIRTTLPEFSMDWGRGVDISTFSSILWSAGAGASAWESGKLESIGGLFLERVCVWCLRNDFHHLCAFTQLLQQIWLVNKKHLLH